jgi:hypothetical protein
MLRDDKPTKVTRGESVTSAKQAKDAKEGTNHPEEPMSRIPDDSWEWIEERAAILEIDSGMDRTTANHRAFLMWFECFVGRTAKRGEK